MERRRTNISWERFIAGEIAAGRMTVANPSVESGHIAYGIGREFLPAGAEPVSVLRYTTGYAIPGAAGTVACRIVPSWAGNDGLSHYLFTGRNAAGTDQTFYFARPSSIWMFMARQTTSVSVNSFTLGFAAGTTHFLVGRWQGNAGGGGTVDLNYDGTNTTTGDLTTQVPTACSYIQFGDWLAGGYSTTGYMGPVLISSVKWPLATVTLLQANTQLYTNLAALVRFLRNENAKGNTCLPTTIWPLQSDSRGFTVLAGV